MDPQPDAALPPPARKAPFPTWKQGLVLFLGGLVLGASACFGFLATLNLNSSRGHEAQELFNVLFAVLFGIGGLAFFIGGVFIFIRMVSALIAPKPPGQP